VSTRRLLLWVSLALSSCGWLAFLPVYYDLPAWIGASCLAGAVAAALGAFGPAPDAEDVRSSRVMAFVLVLVAAGAAYSASWGLRCCLGILALGALTAAWSGLKLRLRGAARGLLTVGIVGLIQGAAIGASSLLLGGAHASSVVRFLDVAILRVLGRSVSVVGETIYVSGATGPVGVTPSWDQFGLAIGIVVWGGIGALLWLAGSGSALRRAVSFLKAAGVTVAYLLFRHVALLMLLLPSDSPRPFWNPVVLILSAVPLVVLLALFVRGLDVCEETRGDPILLASWKPNAMGAGLAAVVTWCVLAALFLLPSGPRKSGAILFDEGHGEWESASTPMDTEQYGLATTYNYASLADWLSYYGVVGDLTGRIREESLEDCSILILKTPSLPYSSEEIDVMEGFVRRGGALFVIGDHTNVFGTTTVLNPVLKRFGLALNYDSTYRLGRGSFTTYVPTMPCLNPITQRVTEFDFLTSCSIRSPLSCYRLMADARILSTQADYGTEDFFPEEHYTLRAEFGEFTQAALATHGAGRVLLFTDSTCFSNFSVFMDGYPSFLMATVAVLSHVNPNISIRLVGLFLGVVGLVLLGLWSFAHRSVPALGLVIGVLLGWSTFYLSACLVHEAAYPQVEPSKSVPYVYFDYEYSDISIEPQPGHAPTYDASREYDTFFVWTQRVARVPQLVEGRNRRGVLSGYPYIVIDPRPDIDAAFLDWIRGYVERGGTLVLMDRCNRDRSGSSELLSKFGLELATECGSRRVLLGAAVETRTISESLVLSISSAEIEEGRVVAVSDSSPFSNLSLGGAFTVPSEVQQRLYDSIYWILEEFAAH